MRLDFEGFGVRVCGVRLTYGEDVDPFFVGFRGSELANGELLGRHCGEERISVLWWDQHQEGSEENDEGRFERSCQCPQLVRRKGGVVRHDDHVAVHVDRNEARCLAEQQAHNPVQSTDFVGV